MLSALHQQVAYTTAILSLSFTARHLAKREETIYGYTFAVEPHHQSTDCLQTRRGPYTAIRLLDQNDRIWRAPCKGGVFPIGERPTRLSLQREALGTTPIAASET